MLCFACGAYRSVVRYTILVLHLQVYKSRIEIPIQYVRARVECTRTICNCNCNCNRTGRAYRTQLSDVPFGPPSASRCTVHVTTTCAPRVSLPKARTRRRAVTARTLLAHQAAMPLVTRISRLFGQGCTRTIDRRTHRTTSRHARRPTTADRDRGPDSDARNSAGRGTVDGTI